MTTTSLLTENTWAGLAPLGETFWGEVAAGLALPVADVEAAASAAGLDSGDVPHPRPDGALRRALNALGIEGRRGPGVTRLATITYPRGEIVASIYDLAADAVAVSHATTAVQTIVYDRGSRSLRFATPWLESEITAAWHAAQGVATSRDVASFVRRVLDRARAVPLKHGAGFYFVPREQSALAERLRAFLGALGSQAGGFPVPDVAAARRDVLRAAADDISADVARLRDEAAEIAARVAADDAPRASTLDRRLGEGQALRDKVAQYAELVGYATGDAYQAVSQIEEQIRALAERERARAAGVPVG